VNTIAIQVPFKDVALNADAKRNPVIGTWSTAERPRVRITGKTTTSTKDLVQVSRLGNPLVNEVVVPSGLKDAFNALPPDKDASVAPVVARVKDPEVPKLIQGIYGVKAPATPRNDLVEIFLTGITTKAGGPIKADLNSQLNNADVNPSAFGRRRCWRLNLSVKPTAKPNRLGVPRRRPAGLPERPAAHRRRGRHRAAGAGGRGADRQAGQRAGRRDGVNANDHAFGTSFPYVALPNVGAVNNGTSAGTPLPVVRRRRHAATFGPSG